MSPLLPAAWLAVRRSHLALPLGAAGVLVVGTLPWQDDGHATSVVHGVVVLVALALALSFDDPTGDVATATPVRRRDWTAARLAAAAGATVPVLVTGILVARLRFPPLPMAGLLAEAAGYLLAAVTAAAGLRAWRGAHSPSYLAVVGVLVVALLTYALPRGWAMVDPQPWGPPYAAALWRWLGFVLVGGAVLAVALRDPLDRRPNAGSSPEERIPTGRAARRTSPMA
jgi:hypothetical protein